MRGYVDVDGFWQGLITFALLASPLVGYIAGYYAATIRIAGARLVAVCLALTLPLVILSWPLLVPWSTQGDRAGAYMGLGMLSVPIFLWILLAIIGAIRGSARRHSVE